MSSILAVFAHPDDEAFGVGGTLALYADQGYRVVLVCATAGESGLNRLDGDTSKVAELRPEELRNACKELGIEPPIFLGYRDSGMAGTPENDHPDALNNADIDVLGETVAEIIRKEQPEAIVTFEQFGWYGHPDHIKMYEAVRRAEELVEPCPPIYCAVFCADAARYSAKVLEDAGEEVPDMFRNRERLRYNLDVIPIIVDTSSVADKKIAALNAHRTQMGPDGVEGRFLPEILKVRTDREYFMPVEHHDALPELLPFERTGGLFGEPAPDPLVPFPILPVSDPEEDDEN